MSNNYLTIANAHWTLTGTVPDPNQVYIKGQGTGGFNIPPTKATVSGTDVSIGTVSSGTAFTANTTQYYSSFTIQWEVSFNGPSGTYQSAGTSANVIYVGLSDTGPAGTTLFRTVVHLACSNAGATNADEAVAKNWALFSDSTSTNRHAGPKGVNGWDETAQTWTRPLYYYQKTGADFRHFGQSAQNSVADLLGTAYGGSGQCGVWADLLAAVFAVNGVSSTVIDATIIPSSGYTLFWVNNWTENDMTIDFNFPGKPGYFSNDLMPNPAGGNYGAMSDATGAAGQHSPTPSEKCWGDHAFTQYKTLYYDPSYGFIHTGPADLQSNCIKCFGKSDGRSPTGEYRYKLTEETNTVIQF